MISVDIGKKIKALRTSQNLTLKELSEKTHLSTGFLSQLERGLTTVDTNSLEHIAEALQVDLSHFFPMTKSNARCVVRSYEREIFQIENSHYIHYYLTNDMENKDLLPRLVEVLPTREEELSLPYNHEGEEFIYVLEGILSLTMEGETQDLFPGDCAHIDSTLNHNWSNNTNKVVKLLIINTPNAFKKSRKSKTL